MSEQKPINEHAAEDAKKAAFAHYLECRRKYPLRPSSEVVEA